MVCRGTHVRHSQSMDDMRSARGSRQRDRQDRMPRTSTTAAVVTQLRSPGAVLRGMSTETDAGRRERERERTRTHGWTDGRTDHSVHATHQPDRLDIPPPCTANERKPRPPTRTSAYRRRASVGGQRRVTIDARTHCPLRAHTRRRLKWFQLATATATATKILRNCQDHLIGRNAWRWQSFDESSSALCSS